MNKKHLRTLALLKQIPFCPKYFKKNIHVSTEKTLTKQGWFPQGEGFDSSMHLVVYKLFFRDTIVDISFDSAIPHFLPFSSEADYYFYGKIVEREYLYYFPQTDTTELRGVSYRQIPASSIAKLNKSFYDIPFGDYC